MKCMAAMMMLMGFVSAAVAAAPPDSTKDRRLAPPSRPRPISLVQFEALGQLSDQPRHARILAQRAAYSPETSRKITEFGVHATQIGIPAAILLVLMAAAPL